MKKNLIVLSSFVLALMLVLTPALVFAQGTVTAPTVPTSAQIAPGGCGSNTQIDGIEKLLCRISTILNSVIPVLVAVGVVFFVFGVVSYVIANDEEAKKKGRNRIIFGIIGLAVIIAMWGLVNVLTNTFQFQGGAKLPNVPGITN